jgi:hypothetical protein
VGSIKCKIPALFVCVALSALLVACSLVDSGPDACDGQGILFQDDFSGELDCGWVLDDRGGAVVAIEEGSLRISTSQPGQIWWTNPRRNFDDVIINVQARQAGGPNDNAYGVICRYQSPENFYLFLISGDGYYAIGKYQSGSSRITYLSGDGQYQYSDVINQGIATNQMRVGCVGNELSLAVNGLPMATVTDPTFVTGDVGLGVSTFELGTAVVEFDNIRVIAP